MNKHRKMRKCSKRTIPFFMAAMVGLTAVPALPTYAAVSGGMDQETIAANAEKYGLTKDIQDGAILHCWCWSFNTIKENMADIAAAGFTSVQTSPANECNDTHPTMKLMGNDTTNGTDGCWWWHYQPTDWKIGNYQLGTKEDFEAMCDEADKYGVKVIVDVIPNHVTPELDEVSQDLYNAAGGRDLLFHANGFKPIQNGGDWSWGNRLACTTGEMGGLPDVNTENEGFQKYFMNYLNDLIECGADGFRYDTAKHIGVPSDPTDPRSPENDFWPVATGREDVDGIRLKDADRIFTYGEVLQGDNVPEREYAEYMRMTASSYGGKLRGAVTGQNFSVNNLMSWQHAAPKSLVTWVESHDTYCNAGESVHLTDTQLRLAWAVIAARADGTPLFFSRPDGSNGWANRWGKNQIGIKGNDQFKHPEVAAVNKFRNAMAGQQEYMRNIDGDSKVLQIDRGTKGTCIINLGEQRRINSMTKLENGTYTDQVSGRTFTVSNGKISGELSKESVAVIYKAGPSVAIGALSAETENGKKQFATETTKVTLHAKNVTNAQYSTTEGAKGSFKDGDVITVGKSLKVGDSVTITMTADSEQGKITEKLTLTKTDVVIAEGNVAYISLPSGWNEPYAYVYSRSNEANKNAEWPGVKMEKVAAGESGAYANLYKYEVPEDIEDPLVIFYGGDNSHRYPADMEPGLELDGSMIYVNGSWEAFVAPVARGKISLAAQDGQSTFKTEKKVVLHAENVTNAQYSTTDGQKGSFKDGDVITVGKNIKAGESVTVTITADSKQGKLTEKATFKKVAEVVETGDTAYINLPSGWDEPYAYVYSKSNESNKNAQWPGVKMEKVSASESGAYGNLYKYNVPDSIEDPLVIFFGGDNSRRYPGDMESGMELNGSMIFADGKWTDFEAKDPVDWETLVTGEYDVYMKKPADWGSNISCYAYENEQSNNAAWPGVQMENLGEGVYAYNIPDGWTNANIIFNDGSRQIPGAMQPGYEYAVETSMLYFDGQWTEVEKSEEKPEEKPDEKLPIIQSSVEDGASFDDESMEVTLTLENAASGSYSLDGGPEQTFEDSVTVVVGKGKIPDSDITLKVTAKGEETAEQTFTFHKDFNAEKNGGSVEYEVTNEEKPALLKAADEVATGTALSSYYGTNMNGQAGANKTITSAADFTEDMIIAQGVANDDPRIFRGSHEGPVYDTYALYGAWDDENVYLGWQITNVTDVVDPAQGYPISDNGKPYNGDIPQILALNVGSGNAGPGTLDTGGYVWGIDVAFETPIDTMLCFSSKPGVGAPAIFKTAADGTFSYDTCVGFEEAGISYQHEDGFFGSKMMGVKGNGYDGYVPEMLLDESSDWVDFLEEGHSPKQDTFYTMTIPMDALGITKEHLENNGIGVMHISTFGASGIGCIPMDMTMLDCATVPYGPDESTSAEKEDLDFISVPLAKLGKAGTEGGGTEGGGTEGGGTEGGGETETEIRTMSVNFGADKCAPQTDETDLTLKAETTGGEGKITYAFAVDGKEVENATADTALWDTTGGTHTISVTATDEQGHKVVVEKEYDITGEAEEKPETPEEPEVQEKELKVTAMTASKESPQKPLTKVKFTTEAEGGSGKLQYRYVRISADGTEKVLKEFRDQNYVTINPRKGTYTIRVEVRDEKGQTVEETMEFTWK